MQLVQKALQTYVHHLSFFYLSGFFFLFIARTFFPLKMGASIFLFTIALISWIAPVVVLFFVKAARDLYDKKLAQSLWLIFAMGFVALLCYLAQSDLFLGKMIINQEYAESKSTLEKFSTFFKAAYMILLLASAIFAGIFQASLKALLADSRRSQFLQTTAINIGLLLALLIAVNYAGKLRPATLDMTLMRKYSLSPGGKTLIGGIERKVTITAFFAFFGENQREVQLMLDDIQATNPNIKYTLYNAHVDKEVAEAKKVASNNVVLFESIDPEEVDIVKREKSRRVSVTNRDDLKKMERDFVSALLGVSQVKKNIYFTSGHGEYSGSGPFVEELISILQDDMRQQTYEIKYLSAENGFPPSIPKDADAVAIMGAQKKFNAKERKALKKYLMKGGKVLLALDPTLKPTFNFLFEPFHFAYHREKVLSEKHGLGKFENVVASTYTNHAITNKLAKLNEKARISFFPGVGYFKNKTLQKTKVPGFEVEYFITSNFRSWNDKVRNGIQDIKKEPSKAFNLAVAVGRASDKVETESANTRLVAFADSNFVTNQYVGYVRNHVVAANALKWLLEDERIMGILPVKWDEGRIKMSEAQDNMLFYFLTFVWPVVFLGGGFAFVRHRRKREG